MNEIMNFLLDNWEVTAAVIALAIDSFFGAIDNSKFKWKGIVFKILSMIGDKAKMASEYDSSKK